jgi:hypothetical protein
MNAKGAAMPPQDKTPVGDAMTHRFPEQKIPDDKPGASERKRIESDVSDSDITQPADGDDKRRADPDED